MILNHEQALFASNYFQEYFRSFPKIEDYMRQTKLERVRDMPPKLPFHSYEDDFFVEFDMHPLDMDIEVRIADKRFWDLLEVTSSHINQSSAPGRRLELMVYERNVNKVLGFIKIGSPVLNLKPRTEWLGAPLKTNDLETMQRFNGAACMGHIIVPVQPFGYNYLGGKLLAAICCSHAAKDIFDRKYNANLCHFETTSLYGTSKGASQYDGMRPYLRYKGLTESDFVPHLTDEKYRFIKRWFEKDTDVELKVPSSSVKMTTTRGMISKTLKALKEHDKAEYHKFRQAVEGAKGLVEKKRAYMCDYGYANSREYILGQTDTLVKKDNYDSYSLENVIKWWKKRASKRYDALLEDNRLRRNLEIWSEDANIDIIR
jgi:hypothetical protein